MHELLCKNEKLSGNLTTVTPDPVPEFTGCIRAQSRGLAFHSSNSDTGSCIIRIAIIMLIKAIPVKSIWGVGGGWKTLLYLDSLRIKKKTQNTIYPTVYFYFFSAIPYS